MHSAASVLRQRSVVHRNYYQTLLGGYADRFDPPVAEGPPRAWCNGEDCVLDRCNLVHGEPGWERQMCVPNGVVYPQTLFNTSHWRHWSGNANATVSGNASKPMIWVMASSYYSQLQWVVESIDRETHAAQGLEDMSFGLGGFQMLQATPMGGAWYVEGVLEELDAPGEFFYEK